MSYIYEFYSFFEMHKCTNQNGYKHTNVQKILVIYFNLVLLIQPRRSLSKRAYNAYWLRCGEYTVQSESALLVFYPTANIDSKAGNCFPLVLPKAGGYDYSSFSAGFPAG